MLCVSVAHSFSLLRWVPWCGEITCCPPVTHSGAPALLAGLGYYRVNCCEHVWVDFGVNVPFYFSEVNAREGHRRTTVFAETARPSASLAVPFAFPLAVNSSPSSATSPREGVCVILYFSCSDRHAATSDLIVICISLTVSDVELPFMRLFAIFFREMSLLPIF